ncbi:J domain-containing protein [Spirosoma terrae]|uniref:J domain-containing protein n=1 Tax=Spirosoma terrae TaxID=1968276 RepID=A0A6L9LB91_9BACT|nr:hypothetical protein [Spirosoma terrae]NDU96672.1 hypothetical protein [Spirosoma terrae]
MSGQQQLVQIGTAKEKAILSKSQKEFNRLIRKIEKVSAELTDLRNAAEKIQQRVQRDYRPLVEQYANFRADMVRMFDRAYEESKLTKTEKKKLAHLIQEMAFELIDTYGLSDLKVIYDKYDDQGFDQTNAESDELTADLMKEMMSSMFGIQFDENADVSDPQKMTAYVQEQIAQREAAETERRQQAQEKRAKKPKTEKQQEREAKKLAEERSITKAVRTLYMDLVKTFHPDREPDETEKQRKTDIMHRVTEAYEKGDLLALLRLQLEFERIDQQHLENLAEEQLKYYNKILKQQAQEIDDELFTLQSQLSGMTGRPAYLINSPIALEFSLNSDISQIKRDIKQIKADLKAFTDLSVLKKWLKAYRIEKPENLSFFDLI